MATYEINPNPEILRRYYVAIGAEDVDALMPAPVQPNPLEIAGAEAEVRKTAAEATKTEAEAVKTGAEAAATVSGVQRENARLEMDAAGLALEATKPEKQAA